MFKTTLLVSFMLITTFIYSQDQNELSTMAKLNIGLHGVAAAYEQPISKRWVVDGAIGAGMGAYTIGGSVNYLFELTKPVPFTKVKFRYIYNREKRSSKGKSLLRNSGNYIGLQGKYSFGNSSYRTLNQFLLGEVHWGIQRSRNKSVFNFHIGIGHFADLDTSRSRLSPTLGIVWGWQVFRPKK